MPVGTPLKTSPASISTGVRLQFLNGLVHGKYSFGVQNKKSRPLEEKWDVVHFLILHTTVRSALRSRFQRRLQQHKQYIVFNLL